MQRYALNMATLTQPRTSTVPDSWFTDYASGNYYAMMSLTDYIAARRSGASLDSYEISY